MADNIEKLADEIQTHLDSNIDDPASQRNQGDRQWISVEPLQFDIPKYPYIKIIALDEQHDGRGIGQNERDVEATIRIRIFNHITNKFDIDDDNERERSDRVLGYLKSRVVEEINNSQSVWRQIDCVNQVTTTNVARQNTSSASIIGKYVDTEVLTVSGGS